MQRRAFALASLAAWFTAPMAAGSLEPPAAAPVLAVTGRVRQPNVGDRAVFDLPMLERMPQASFTTRTPWYAQPRKFTGPLLRDVLAAAGAQGQWLRVQALNDYRVDIPFDDAQRFDMIVARLLDDKPMPVRDKGPLFIIYPFDLRPELRNALYFSRSAWQLKTIDVQ
jgi:hypothetical protein